MIRLVVFALLAAPSAAYAGTVDDTVFDPLSWQCAWSAWRWLLLAAAAAAAWLFAFHWWFPTRLAVRPGRSQPWPMDTFGGAAAGWVLAVAVGFVVLFAGASDELTRKPLQVLPGGNSFVNRNALWVVVLAAGVMLAAATRYLVFRHRES